MPAASSTSTGSPSGICRRPISGGAGTITTPPRQVESLSPWLRDWKFDGLDFPGLIRNCPHAYEYPLVDRDPIPLWTFGLTTLIGDAAHPMYPVGSNGAPQAI